VRAQTILFDLDGTLSDSARGILAALRHAFVVNGLPPMDARTEREVLGPPFYESLPPLIGDVPLEAIIAAYRESYSATDSRGAGGMFDTAVFPGVAELVESLRANGCRLAIATSKPERYAVPIVEHLGLADQFDVIGGDALDGSRGTKALVIAEVLRRLGNPAPSEVWMIGDRRHDVEGARAHGIESVGVRWGYALPGELEAAAPWAICTTATEVGNVIEAGRDAAAS
jgi:phosphoglycolate phosphatase